MFCSQGQQNESSLNLSNKNHCRAQSLKKASSKMWTFDKVISSKLFIFVELWELIIPFLKIGDIVVGLFKLLMGDGFFTIQNFLSEHEPIFLIWCHLWNSFSNPLYGLYIYIFRKNQSKEQLNEINLPGWPSSLKASYTLFTVTKLRNMSSKSN